MSEYPTPDMPPLPKGERWAVRRIDPEDFEVAVSIESDGYGPFDGRAIHERGFCQPYAWEIEMLAAELAERRNATRAVVGTYRSVDEAKRVE